MENISGIDAGGMGDVSPPKFDKGGMVNVIIPPPHIVKIFCLIFTNIQTKSTNFSLKNGWFLVILAKFSQNAQFWSVRPKELCFLPITCSKSAPKSIHQIARFQSPKLQNFPASEGGTSPLRHPPVCASTQLALTCHLIIKKNVKDGSMPLTVLSSRVSPSRSLQSWSKMLNCA